MSEWVKQKKNPLSSVGGKQKSKLLDKGRKGKGAVGVENVSSVGKVTTETEEVGQSMPPIPPCYSSILELSRLLSYLANQLFEGNA